MTSRRRFILTTVSLLFGMSLSAMLYYMKWGAFTGRTWLNFLTVFGYSALIVIGIGWFLQRRSNKNR